MLEFQINSRQWLNFYLTYFSKRQFLFVYGILVKIFVEKKNKRNICNLEKVSTKREFKIKSNAFLFESINGIAKNGKFDKIICLFNYKTFE